MARAELNNVRWVSLYGAIKRPTLVERIAEAGSVAGRRRSTSLQDMPRAHLVGREDIQTRQERSAKFLGIYRTYLTRQDSLPSPRGRILFSHLARGPLTTATLPCPRNRRIKS